jgi:hypothetical protein
MAAEPAAVHQDRTRAELAKGAIDFGPFGCPRGSPRCRRDGVSGNPAPRSVARIRPLWSSCGRRLGRRAPPPRRGRLPPPLPPSVAGAAATGRATIRTASVQAVRSCGRSDRIQRKTASTLLPPDAKGSMDRCASIARRRARGNAGAGQAAGRAARDSARADPDYVCPCPYNGRCGEVTLRLLATHSPTFGADGLRWSPGRRLRRVGPLVTTRPKTRFRPDRAQNEYPMCFERPRLEPAWRQAKAR